MPKPPRRLKPGTPIHVTQRGVNRGLCFFNDEDRGFYLELLSALAKDTDCDIHAYVLMGNHVHLLMTPQEDGAAQALMLRLGQRYVRAFNRAHGRSGTLWEGRFRSSMATDEGYVLACYRYVELNPVRAGIATDPGAYPWSSHRANALGLPSRMLVPHERYFALGLDDDTRRRAYRALVSAGLPEETRAGIRRATATNGVLANV